YTDLLSEQALTTQAPTGAPASTPEYQSDTMTGPIRTNDPVTHYTGLGVALGTCFGTVFGAAFGDIGTGLGLGLAIGVAVGAGIGARKKKAQNKQDADS
ncbi:MAG: hypothetical protein AAF299_16355, partial [Pseudomonadota bacterium]